MKRNKKNIFNIIFLIAVFIFTLYSVFNGQDFSSIVDSITKVSPRYVIIAVGLVVLFIYGESHIIHYMFESLGILSRRWTCFLYSCVGFFFSCITPSATGGQPAQIYYMKKNEVPIPISSVVLMIVTITYKFVLVAVGLFLLVFQMDFVVGYMGEYIWVFYLGIFLNVVCVAFMLILVFNHKLATSFMMWGEGVLVKLHILKKKQERVENLKKSMVTYNNTANYLRTHKRVVVKVLIITFVQRFAMFFVTYFIYKAFYLEGTSMYDIVMLQAVIAVSVDMLPLPGGMGISEHLFLVIFSQIFGPEYLMPGMILSRGLGYYTELILSAVLTIFAHFTVAKKGPETELLKHENLS